MHNVFQNTENLDQFYLPNIHVIRKKSLVSRYGCSGLKGSSSMARILRLWKVCQKIKPAIMKDRHLVTFYGLDVNKLPTQKENNRSAELTASGWLNNHVNLIFVILILLNLIPLWIFKHFPSQDGPSHLANVNILLNYYKWSMIKEYLDINYRLIPNLITYPFLMGFMLILPYYIAEKLLLSLYIIGFPLSFRYALTGISKKATLPSLLVFIYIYNYTFHKGFYNFSYALIIFFLIIGYWLRLLQNSSFWKIILLSMLGILLYFSHILSLLMLIILMGVLLIWFGLFNIMIDPLVKPISVIFNKDFVGTFIAFLPSLILTKIFLDQQGKGDAFRIPALRLIELLFINRSIASYSEKEIIFCMVLSCLLLLLIASVCFEKIRNRQISRSDGLIIVIMLYGILYFIIPNIMSGGADISVRINLYIWLMLILWLGSQYIINKFNNMIVILVIMLSLSLLAFRTIEYSKINNYIDDYLSGISVIKPYTILLPLSFDSLSLKSLTKYGVKPLMHAAGYIGAQKCIIILDNYEANTDYFPTIFRPDKNPYVIIGDIQSVPPKSINIISFNERTGNSINYVILWGLKNNLGFNKEARSIENQLDAGKYHLIYTSKNIGLMRIYSK